MEKANPKSNRWVIDWPELKQIALRLLDGNSSDFKRNKSRAEAHASTGLEGWRGCTNGQIRRWLSEGFQSDAIKFGEFDPPMRSKRKYIFAEEGDEFHYDIAMAGDDNYMSSFTKREEIPGLAIRAELGFSVSVSAEILNKYYTWLCSVAYSLETAGIDTEITLDYECQGLWQGKYDSKTWATSIRVKRENEGSDFHSWSPMLSPASFRYFMFVALELHGEMREKDTSPGLGSRRQSQWQVKFDRETRTLHIEPDYGAYDFPESRMETQLRAALKEAMQNA